MPDLNRTQNFADGDLVTAQKLKDLIDQTSIQPFFLTSKSILFQDTLTKNDRLLAYAPTSGAFMQLGIGDLMQGGNMTNGLKFWEYEGGSEYGKTFLYSRSPTSDTFCGIFIDAAGASSGAAVVDPKWGTVNIAAASSLLNIAGSHSSEGTSFVFNAGWPISRATNENTGGSFNFTANRSITDFNNKWELQFDSTVTGGSGTNQYSEFKVTKTFDKHDTSGSQKSSLGTSQVKAISIVQKAVDGKSTDTVEVKLLNELTVPVVNATTVDATTFKKSGTATIFPLKRGYSEFEFGSESAAYIAVTDCVFAAGYNYVNSFKVNALVSGGFLMWETTNSLSLQANEVMYLTIDVWHNELSTSQGAYMDYRLRLKAKTVGGATYPQKELAVRRFQVASANGVQNNRMTFKIERSDFPVGSEDITRQLQVQFTEANAGIAYHHFIVRATAEVWNKNDIADGTAALL
jgi:hypothetical protein